MLVTKKSLYINIYKEDFSFILDLDQAMLLVRAGHKNMVLIIVLGATQIVALSDSSRRQINKNKNLLSFDSTS